MHARNKLILINNFRDSTFWFVIVEIVYTFWLAKCNINTLDLLLKCNVQIHNINNNCTLHSTYTLMMMIIYIDDDDIHSLVHKIQIS